MNSSQEPIANHENEEQSKSSDRTLRASASQCLAAFATNLIKFTYGSFFGVATIIIAEVYKKDAEIKMSLSELTWFGSHCFMLPVGSLLIGPLAQYLGPRRSMLICTVIFLIAWTLFYFATNATMLLLAQAIGGITVPVCLGPGATYVIEIAQPHLRSALVASTNLSIITGAFLTILYSNWLHWKTIVLIDYFSPILGLFAVYMIPESPHWLASKGKFKEAEKALSWLRGWSTPENVSQEFNSLKATYSLPVSNSTKSYRTAFKPYFNRSFLVPLASVGCMFLLHSLTGFNAILSYCMVIFKSIDSPIDSHAAASIFDAMRIIGALLCIFTVHFVGKRKLIFISLIAAGLIYLLISTLLFLKTQSKYARYFQTFTWIVSIALEFSTLVTSAGIDKVIFMYNAELFPTKYRNIGTGFGVFMFTICGAIVSKSYLYLVAAVSLSGTFLIFGTFCFVGCITFYFLLPETEGKTLQEIGDLFKKTSSSKHDQSTDK